MQLIANISRQKAATFIALFFHAIGLGGILLADKTLFAALTPYNLLLSALLLLWTQTERTNDFLLFFILCFATGFAAEYVGVNYQWLFGAYTYKPALGFQWQGVPLIIGINWFIIIYSTGSFVQALLDKIWNSLAGEQLQPRSGVGFFSVILDGALLATLFDWIMEPVAIHLGYWEWTDDGSIPLKNYISWFGVSAFLLFFYKWLRFPKPNHFAVNLFLIQLMFFLILRTVI